MKVENKNKSDKLTINEMNVCSADIVEKMPICSHSKYKEQNTNVDTPVSPAPTFNKSLNI